MLVQGAGARGAARSMLRTLRGAQHQQLGGHDDVAGRRGPGRPGANGLGAHLPLHHAVELVGELVVANAQALLGGGDAVPGHLAQIRRFAEAAHQVDDRVAVILVVRHVAVQPIMVVSGAPSMPGGAARCRIASARTELHQCTVIHEADHYSNKA